MKEDWSFAPGNEDYMVSTLGRVMSLKFNRRRILKAWVVVAGGGIGYLKVSLSKMGKRRIWKVHRLVAKTFVPNPDDKENVNHIDGNSLNNVPSNLEWCTPKENTKNIMDRKVQTIDVQPIKSADISALSPF